MQVIWLITQPREFKKLKFLFRSVFLSTLCFFAIVFHDVLFWEFWTPNKVSITIKRIKFYLNNNLTEKQTDLLWFKFKLWWKKEIWVFMNNTFYFYTFVNKYLFVQLCYLFVVCNFLQLFLLGLPGLCWCDQLFWKLWFYFSPKKFCINLSYNGCPKRPKVLELR